MNFNFWICFVSQNCIISTIFSQICYKHPKNWWFLVKLPKYTYTLIQLPPSPKKIPLGQTFQDFSGKMFPTNANYHIYRFWKVGFFKIYFPVLSMCWMIILNAECMRRKDIWAVESAVYLSTEQCFGKTLLSAQIGTVF